MRKPNFSLSLASTGLLALTLFTAACGSKDPEPESLYVRMGGQAKIEGVANQMVANVGAETGTPNSLMLRSHKPMLDAVEGINGATKDATRLERLRNNVIDQFTDITGGPLTYRGMNMLVAHTNMKVTDAEWTVWRGLLDNSLEKNQIPAKERAEFTALIDAMRADVVNH